MKAKPRGSWTTPAEYTPPIDTLSMNVNYLKMSSRSPAVSGIAHELLVQGRSRTSCSVCKGAALRNSRVPGCELQRPQSCCHTEARCMQHPSYRA